MISKEKAKELFDKYAMYLRSNLMYDEEAREDAKVCALIAVNEMIKELEELLEGDERPSARVYYLWDYYKGVKKEIEKL